MTELQAEQAAVVPRAEVGSQRSRYRDVLIALAAFAVLAILLAIGPAVLALRLAEPVPGQYTHPVPA